MRPLNTQCGVDVQDDQGRCLASVRGGPGAQALHANAASLIVIFGRILSHAVLRKL